MALSVLAVQYLGCVVVGWVAEGQWDTGSGDAAGTSQLCHRLCCAWAGQRGGIRPQGDTLMELGDTRGRAQAGWHPASQSRLLEGALAQERGRDAAGHCSHTVLENGAGPRACPRPWASGSGQAPAQPTPPRGPRSRGDVSQRAKGTAGSGRNQPGGGGGSVKGPKSLTVPEGVVPGDRAAGCHPCAVRAQGCPLPGPAAHTRVHTHRDARVYARTHRHAGPQQPPSPRDFPTPGWTQRPCSPPAPCPDLCTNPPGRPWGGYKEGARGCPHATEPGTGEWGPPR